jgi:hypothetical protein
MKNTQKRIFVLCLWILPIVTDVKGKYSSRSRERTQMFNYNIQVTCRIRGSHSGGYEDLYLLGYNAVYSVEGHSTFRRSISNPSSGPRDSACHLLSRWHLAWFILQPWRWRRHAPKRLLTFNGLHCLISQNIEIFTEVILSFNIITLIVNQKQTWDSCWSAFRIKGWFNIICCLVEWRELVYSYAGLTMLPSNASFHSNLKCTNFIMNTTMSLGSNINVNPLYFTMSLR